jgi:hypothetical protein
MSLWYSAILLVFCIFVVPSLIDIRARHIREREAGQYLGNL